MLDGERLSGWRQAGAVIQMDTAYLARQKAGSRRSHGSCSELEFVDLFASDNHGDTRTLATARDWLLQASTPELRLRS